MEHETNSYSFASGLKDAFNDLDERIKILMFKIMKEEGGTKEYMNALAAKLKNNDLKMLVARNHNPFSE